MKKRLILLTLILSVLAATIGCGHKNSTSDMTPEDILKVLNVKIHKHPKDDNLYYDRAKIFMDLGRVNEAIADLSRAIALDGKKVKYHLLLSDAYFANGSPDDSRRSLQRVLELDPDNQEAHLKYGEVSYYSKDFDRAMQELSSVTAKDPNNRTALFMKSFIYLEKNDPDTGAAVTLLNKICNLYPDYAPAFEQLGVLYSIHHDGLAIEYLSTAHRLDPKNPNILYSMAMFYQELNQMDKAEELYKQILDIDADYKDAWHNRGYIQMFTYGDFEVAVEYLTRAIQADSNFIEAWTNRGCAYELMGDNKRALDDFRTALQIDHTFQPAIDGLDRIRH